MLKCREVPQEIESLHDGQLGWPRRMALRLHLLLCHHCRRYARQLGILLRTLQRQPLNESESVDERHLQQILSQLAQKNRDQ